MKLYKDYSTLPYFVINSEHVKRKGGESCGFAVICTKTQRQLLVRPSESYAFVLFCRGVFHLWKVPQLVSELTKAEYTKLCKSMNDKDYFASLFNKVHCDNNEDALNYAYTRLIDAKSIITNCPAPIKETNDFSYCRGQKKPGESTLTCAYREFFEETGIDLKTIPHTLAEKEETTCTRTSSGLSYISIIHTVYVDEEFELASNYDRTEVNEVAWISL